MARSLRLESPKKPRRPPRRRRDAAAARAAILDAAERELVRSGPAGIRLQEVAKLAGVSHPTVLHHFGSREGLVKAVITRSLAALHVRLIEALRSSTGEEDQLAKILDAAFDALSAQGQGRVMMWLALSGHPIDGADARLADVVEAAHAVRVAKHRGRGKPPAREETGYAVVLSCLALLGSAVLGPKMLENAGLAHDAESLARFRAWLAHLLVGCLDGES